MLNNLYTFDCELTNYNWLFVFKSFDTAQYVVIHDDYEEIGEFMRTRPLLVGFNNKHYDQYILKAVMLGLSPEEVKGISDCIIVHGIAGWEIPQLKDSGIWFDQFDLKDDMQDGLSLKAIEGHLGMNITESSIAFDTDHPLTEHEMEELVEYCKHDVDATEVLLELRKVYIENKLTLGKEKGIDPARALYMTNAKLTAAYLDAKPVIHHDEREYQYPDNILWQYIPEEVVKFFEKLQDKSIPDEVLFTTSLDFKIGECSTRIGWGGAHGSIDHYSEEGEI